MMMMIILMTKNVYGDDDDDDVRDDDAQTMTNTMMMSVGVMTMMIMYRCSNPIFLYLPVSPPTHPYLSIHLLHHHHHKSIRYSMIDVCMDGCIHEWMNR